MNIEESKEKMKMIQNSLLEFLENETNAEENYEIFINNITEYQLAEDKHKLKSVLQLINVIGNNHRRVTDFISKLEQILGYFKKDIQKHFLNSEIFEIFKDNKRILLFLIEEKIITINGYVVLRLMSKEFKIDNYTKYFAPEIKTYNFKVYNSNKYYNDFMEKMKKEFSEEFYEKRKEGENDNYLCELIRKNQVKEFGAYVNRNNIPFESYIEKSIFEINPLLKNIHRIKLVEYASFYGSIDIIRYMRVNGYVTLTPFMWIYAIHSENSELIRYLEDNHVSPPDGIYDEILKESIKCHHNNVSKYIIYYLIKEEYLQNNIENDYCNNLYQYAAEFYNYCFFPENMKYKNMFFYLCEFDYYTLVKLYIEEENIDINTKRIKKMIFFNNIIN